MQVSSIVKHECIVLVGSGTGKHPPEIVEAKEGRVGEASFNEARDLRPAKREVDGFVQTNGFGAECLGNHVDGVLRLEDVWVREMKGFFENDALVGPCATIVAGGKSDLSASGFRIHGFEKHVPGVVAAKHERIGDESGAYVGDVGFRQYGAIPIEFERRRTAVD